jgi:hypothetical protein
VSVQDESIEKDGFLLTELPATFKTFPMVVLTELVEIYKTNITHLNAQIEANVHDAPWCKELKESRTDVKDRLRSVKDILSLYASCDPRGKEKGVALLRMERAKAHDLYATFIKQHPKG